MIVLPENFKQGIINRYEQNGIDWLNSIDKTIEKYTKQFNLSNIQLVDNLSMNLLLFAKSSEFGEVIVKIGCPAKTTITEIQYVSNCSSDYFPKCYFYNVEDKIMILERLSPGYSLNNVKNQEERILTFCTILNDITSNNFPPDMFPSIEEAIEEKIETINKDKQTYSSILHLMNPVNKFYNDIKNLNLPKYVLHDDLQHKNILKSDLGWKTIDPHGIVGEKVFDIPYFILAELKLSNLNNLDSIVTCISRHLSEDKNLIYKALYINTFFRTTFFIKSKYDTDFINYYINLCDTIKHTLLYKDFSFER